MNVGLAQKSGWQLLIGVVSNKNNIGHTEMFILPMEGDLLAQVASGTIVLLDGCN